VDIDLNPMIGPDWMHPGTQRRVLTLGQNCKAYLTGAMDATYAATERVSRGKSNRENSELFIALLARLTRAHRGRKRIHLILDNRVIHTSRETRR